jgi:hypothetical protein
MDNEEFARFVNLLHSLGPSERALALLKDRSAELTDDQAAALLGLEREHAQA